MSSLKVSASWCFVSWELAGTQKVDKGLRVRYSRGGVQRAAGEGRSCADTQGSLPLWTPPPVGVWAALGTTPQPQPQPAAGSLSPCRVPPRRPYRLHSSPRGGPHLPIAHTSVVPGLFLDCAVRSCHLDPSGPAGSGLPAQPAGAPSGSHTTRRLGLWLRGLLSIPSF